MQPHEVLWIATPDGWRAVLDRSEVGVVHRPPGPFTLWHWEVSGYGWGHCSTEDDALRAVERVSRRRRNA